MKNTIKYWLVNSFTKTAFSGNPAAACLITEELEDVAMQAIATELNVGATAFVIRNEHDFGLRWFSPTRELQLCGHGTLAAAHVIWQEQLSDSSKPIRFDSTYGVLECHKSGSCIHMGFPRFPMRLVPAPPKLLDAMRLEDAIVWQSSLDYIVIVSDARTVRDIPPDFQALSAFPVRGIAVTSLSDDPRFDFVSRFFAPTTGINEDPVCGSVHCALGPYWSERLNKNSLVAYQASRRGGTLYLQSGLEGVCLGGHAVTVLRGEICVVFDES